DGFFVILEPLFYWTLMGVDVGEVVPGCRIFWIGFACFLPLSDGAVFIVDIVEKAAVGEARFGVIGMSAKKVFIRLLNGIEPLLDAQSQIVFRRSSAFRAKRLVIANPFI